MGLTASPLKVIQLSDWSIIGLIHYPIDPLSYWFIIRLIHYLFDPIIQLILLFDWSIIQLIHYPIDPLSVWSYYPIDPIIWLIPLSDWSITWLIHYPIDPLPDWSITWLIHYPIDPLSDWSIICDSLTVIPLSRVHLTSIFVWIFRLSSILHKDNFKYIFYWDYLHPRNLDCHLRQQPEYLFLYGSYWNDMLCHLWKICLKKNQNF